VGAGEQFAEGQRAVAVTKQRRSLIVLGSLVGVLSATSALLLAISPAPLAPEASGSLFAVDSPQSLEMIFQTDVPPQPGRWKFIYIHQSNTPSGDAVSLGHGADGVGDHFVIGNGDGAVDGEIQLSQRWNKQAPAAAPMMPANTHGRGFKAVINSACVSICLVGDFEHGRPSALQMTRLEQLVWALQGKLGIPARNIVVLDQQASPLGVGQNFPAASFRQQLLH
jgi:hypothetical protein